MRGADARSATGGHKAYLDRVCREMQRIDQAQVEKVGGYDDAHGPDSQLSRPALESRLPPSIEVSQHILTNLVADWKSSESSRVEVGRTMRWTVSPTNQVTITLSNRIDGDPAGRSVDIPKLHGDDEFAEFHTHPTDPDIGKLYNHWVYLPPSMPDVGRIATNFSAKILAISFVAVSPREIYAVVYLRALTQADGNRLAVETNTFGNAMRAYVLRHKNMTQNDWDDHVYAESRKGTPGQAVQAQMEKWTRETRGYASETPARLPPSSTRSATRSSSGSTREWAACRKSTTPTTPRRTPPITACSTSPTEAAPSAGAGPE